MDNNLVLNRVREAKKLSSETELASYLGITTQRLANWRARNTLDYQLLFTKRDDIDLNWLITGKGEMLQSSEPTPHQNDDVRMELLQQIIVDKDETIASLNRQIGRLEEVATRFQAREKKPETRGHLIASDVFGEYRTDEEVSELPKSPVDPEISPHTLKQKQTNPDKR